MPKRLDVSLSDEQRAELVRARDHHAKAYVREKAAAILKIALEHQPAWRVACSGLLKRRDDETVRSWLCRYRQQGLAGLLVDRGRGRKPAFSPLEQQSAAEQVQELVHQSPLLWGHDQHSWTLQTVQQTVPWMAAVSVPGVCKLFGRLHIVYKRGRAWAFAGPGVPRQARSHRCRPRRGANRSWKGGLPL